MAIQILQFLLEVVSGLVAGACLLRLYMQAQRVPFSNPIGQLVFALSDWLVLPLRRLIRPGGKFDLSCLLGAVLVKLVHYTLLVLLVGGVGGWVLVPLLALFGLLGMVLTGCIGILIVFAILSWVQPYAPIASILARLSEPLLHPIRRVLPLVKGIDLSPLVAIVALQVLQMVLAQVQVNLLMGSW